MLKELLKLYQTSLVNTESPECLFAEILIFNEGWLLRSALREWMMSSRNSALGFLPFPRGVKVYSEGQLYTPFKARYRGDKRAESHTHVDGVVGDFSIADTKSGVRLNRDFRYIAVFETKLYSPIAGGTKNAPHFDQVSRTAACLINSILMAGSSTGYHAHLVILYASDNHRIDPTAYSKASIENQIATRVDAFMETETPDDLIRRFATEWRSVLENLQIWFVTWEDVLADIGSQDLDQFYSLCKRFNRPAGTQRLLPSP